MDRATLLKSFGRHAIGYFVQPGAFGVELGVVRGYFSEALLRSGRFANLVSVDRWGDHHDDVEWAGVRERLAPFGEASTVLRAGFDEAIASFADHSLDFLYVDGYAHTGHDADLLLRCLPKLKPGALVAAHDYDPFSWPRNHARLGEVFRGGLFVDVEVVPGVLTPNDEDLFPSIVARYGGGS